MDFRDQFGTNGTLENITDDKPLNFPELEVYLRDWQNPAEADKLLKIEKELNEVQNIVHQNLNDLLKRG